MVKNNKEHVFQRIYFSLRAHFQETTYVTTNIITGLVSIPVIFNVKSFGKICFMIYLLLTDYDLLYSSWIFNF